MSPAITAQEPLLSPQHVQILTDDLALLHKRIADVDRIERCRFECGDLRATLHALANQINDMLTHMGNVPPGIIPRIGQQARPLVPSSNGGN
jgi:hypothetical protein